MLADSMIEECVQDALKLCSTNEKCLDAKIACEKLATKFDFYSSYHVTVTVDSRMSTVVLSRILLSTSLVLFLITNVVCCVTGLYSGF